MKLLFCILLMLCGTFVFGTGQALHTSDGFSEEESSDDDEDYDSSDEFMGKVNDLTEKLEKEILIDKKVKFLLTETAHRENCGTCLDAAFKVFGDDFQFVEDLHRYHDEIVGYAVNAPAAYLRMHPVHDVNTYEKFFEEHVKPQFRAFMITQHNKMITAASTILREISKMSYNNVIAADVNTKCTKLGFLILQTQTERLYFPEFVTRMNRKMKKSPMKFKPIRKSLKWRKFQGNKENQFNAGN